MVNKIINFALLAAVIWFGYTQILPWFRSLNPTSSSRRGGSFDAGQGEDAECVEAARHAAETFSEEMRAFSRPPIDREAWDRAYLRVENRIGVADDLCTCERDACSSARAALSTLRDLGDDFSSAARGDGEPPLNAASALSKIYDNIDAAAEQARGSSF
jgi:hypothetical protein